MTFGRSGTVEGIVCNGADGQRGDHQVDLCVFDPPYFDYIDYSELSEFYRCWFPHVELPGKPLLPEGDDPAEHFGLDLGRCIRVNLANLTPGRPVVFTYHSANPEAWRAVGIALDEAKLLVTALWPVRTDGHMGHHSLPGNCEWDLVVVCRRLHEIQSGVCSLTVADWIEAVNPLGVGDADRRSMELSIDMAAPRFGVQEQ
jgi:putative DNA methylase